MRRTLPSGLSLLAVVTIVGSVGCGDSSTSPDPSATPAGRWVGAQPIGNSPEPKPNCSLGLSPELAMDARGGAMAAWLSDCSIWVARYEPAQGWLRPEIIGSLPAGAPANWIWEPALAVNDAGAALVVWTTQVTAGEGNRQVWARTWDSALGWGTPERIGDRESGPDTENENPRAALDPSANGVVIWGSDGIVTVRRVAGRGWAAADRLSLGISEFNPNVFLDASGRGFAVWNETQTAVVARFDPITGWEAPTRFGNEDGWSFGGPGRLAFDRDGRAVLVWNRVRGRLQPTVIWSTTFDRGIWAPWIQISTPGAVEDPQVGLSAAGVGLAAWRDAAGTSFARRDGLRFGAPGTVASASGLDPQALDLAVNDKADGILAWTRTAEPRIGVEASRYTNGRWTGPETVRAGTTARHPAAALDGCGNAIVIWSEYEGESVRIWGNRFDAGCR
jgi:hypothetical protein